MTANEAALYDRVRDDIVFSTPGSSAANTPVTYNPDGTVFIYSNAIHSGLTFGAGARGESGFSFPDGSVLLIGSSAAETVAGGAGIDVLYGSDGDDALIGGAGGDQLYGGLHSDLFMIRAGESGVTLGLMDEVGDWEARDSLSFASTAATASNYAEITAASFALALAGANAQIATGAVNYVAAQVGGDVYVFADSRGDDGGADDAVLLRGVDLGSISAANITDRVAVMPPVVALGGFGADTLAGQAADDQLRGLAGNDSLTGGNGEDTLIGDEGDDWLVGGGGRDRLSGGDGYDTFYRANGDSAPNLSQYDTITDWSSNDRLVFGDVYGGVYQELTGTDYLDAFGRANLLIAGGSARFVAVQVGADVFVFGDSLNNGGIGDAVMLAGRTLADISAVNVQGAVGASGGWPGPESVILTSGPDVYSGGGGADTIQGRGGDDRINGGDGTDYLRGDDGSDSIIGGADFDDINGNAGNDTASGGDGDDWVVGGKDNDSLTGDAGSDIVYGNLGNDTLDGGAGNDIIRGGQGSDVLFGREGDDWISGDRGDDVMTGGPGADTFHSSQDAGVDRVLDFNYAEGDRVRLDPGTTYELRQMGPDLWVYMGGSHQVILEGITGSLLPPDWIFVG